jgi:stringent starvation protein B
VFNSLGVLSVPSVMRLSRFYRSSPKDLERWADGRDTRDAQTPREKILCHEVLGLHTVETLQITNEFVEHFKLDSDSPGVVVWIQRCQDCEKLLNVVTNARPGVLLTQGAPVFTEWFRGVSMELTNVEAQVLLDWAADRTAGEIESQLQAIRMQIARHRDSQTNEDKDLGGPGFLKGFLYA